MNTNINFLKSLKEVLIIFFSLFDSELVASKTKAGAEPAHRAPGPTLV